MGAVITQAMRGFAGWASGRSYRPILLAIVFVQLLAPVAGALMVLECLRRGAAAATTSALIALAGIALADRFVVGAGLVESLGVAAPVLLGGAAGGAMLGWSRNLSFAFQGMSVGAIGVTLAVFALVPGASGLGEYLMAQTLQLLESLNWPPDQVALFAATPPELLVQFLLTTLMASLLSALMLGYWWFALLSEGVDFGADFRALKLGRIAGSLLVLLVVLQLIFDVGLINVVAQLGVVAFLFQGLAVMHARSRSHNWHGAIVVLVYVALFSFSPLSLVAIAGLSVVGLLDNFFALRARAGPRD